jgi:hypothetical protein
LKDAKAALIRDVHFLSHQLLEGRDAGTKGIDLAARYIAQAFKASGLSGAFAKKGYFQTYSVTTGVQAGANNSLTVTSGKQSASFKKTVQFVPFGFSKSGKVKAKVAFVGFGITDPASGYDDYKGIDVKGKIVLMLRYTPRWWSKTKHMFGRRKSLYAAFRYKLLNARSKGALGVILVDLPRRAKEKPGPLVSLRLTRGLSDAGIVAVHAREAVANQILGKGRFSALVNQIEEALKPRSFVTNAVVELQVELQKKQARIKNVAAMVPGTDPVLRKEVVVVGAHYDHLGYGHVGAFPGNQGKIHPGADDNASGTSVMLTMARAFARKPAKRTMLFVAFSGEERGLLGSAYFVKHSPIPLSRMVTMVNLDMVGQMKGRRMVVQGSMTSPTFVPVLEGLARRHHLQVKLGPSGYGPSDHTSFYARKIPVLFFFTGAHSRYHRPNDVFSSLNLEGMFRVYKYVSDVTRRISMSSRRPSYRKVLSPLPRRKARGGMRAYLGSIPDYGSQRKNGVKLTGVRAGGPADKGGIKGGDVLLKMGRFGLKNLYDMVFALRYYRPGDTIVVEVLRGGKRLKLRVKLGQRRSYRR